MRDKSGERLFDALMSVDVDRLEFELEESRRERFRKNMPDFMDAFKKTVHGDRVLEVLKRWLCHPQGQHAPPVEKGDLIRWIEDDGLRLPTIRSDMAAKAVQGKIYVQGRELVAWLSSRLTLETRARITKSS